MGVTPNGIRFPDDPDLFADVILFFTQLAEDVDTKFLPLTGGDVVGKVGGGYFESSAGGNTQASYVLRTNPNGGFDFYDDNLRIDGSPGRRLWIAGPNQADVAIAPRFGEAFNKVLIRGTNVEIDGTVTIKGGLDVQGQATKRYSMEDNFTLQKTAMAAWTGMSGQYAGTTFVAPPSGAVTIGFGGLLPARNKQVALTYEIRRGPGLGGGEVVLAATPWPGIQQPPPHSIATNGMSDEVGQWVSVYTAYFKGGLVPGETYNIKPYYVNENTSTLTLYRAYFIISPDL